MLRSDSGLLGRHVVGILQGMHVKLIVELVNCTFEFLIVVLIICGLGAAAICFSALLLGVLAAAMVTSPFLLLGIKIHELITGRKMKKRKAKGDCRMCCESLHVKNRWNM